MRDMAVFPGFCDNRCMVNTVEVEHEIVSIVARARQEGWYEDASGWTAVDELLARLGYDTP